MSEANGAIHWHIGEAAEDVVGCSADGNCVSLMDDDCRHFSRFAGWIEKLRRVPGRHVVTFNPLALDYADAALGDTVTVHLADGSVVPFDWNRVRLFMPEFALGEVWVNHGDEWMAGRVRETVPDTHKWIGPIAAMMGVSGTAPVFPISEDDL
jgi:hypothetical protein